MSIDVRVRADYFERSLVESLAAYLRNRLIYPASNRRVRDATDALRSALAALVDRTPKVNITLTAHEASVAGTPIEIDSVALRWLADTLRRVSLQGVEFDDSLTDGVLDEFAVMLQRCTIGACRPLKPESFAERSGLRPIELVIRGAHKAAADESESSAPDATLAPTAAVDSVPGAVSTAASTILDGLRADPDIQARLGKVQTELDRRFGSDQDRQEIDLLARIVDLARANAAFDPKQASQIVNAALDTFDNRILSSLESTEASESGLIDIALRVAHRYFVPRTARADITEDQELPSGRPEDESVVDDLDGLLSDLAVLPFRDAPPTFEGNTEVVDHHVHVLVATLADPLLPETAMRAATRIARIAHADRGCDLSPLSTVLRASLPVRSAMSAIPEDPQVDHQDPLAVLHAFEEVGEFRLLVDRELIEPELIAVVFPRWFEIWVDHLDPLQGTDQRLFARFLDAVDPETFDAGLRLLMTKRVLLGESRLLRAAQLAGRRAGQFLASACTEFPTDARPVCLVWLSAADASGIEFSALRLLPANLIPNDHISALCRYVAGDGSLAQGLVTDAGILLRRFVLEAEGDARFLEARLRAVRALGSLPSPQTRSLLVELSKAWKLGSSERRELRRAAEEALRELLG